MYKSIENPIVEIKITNKDTDIFFSNIYKILKNDNFSNFIINAENVKKNNEFFSIVRYIKNSNKLFIVNDKFKTNYLNKKNI